MTAAARLALAGIVGAGVRLSAAEVAQLLAAFSRLRRVGEAELDAASDAKVAAAAERRATRRLPKSPQPPLPPQDLPEIVPPSWASPMPNDGHLYSLCVDGTWERVRFPTAAETYERKPGAMLDALAQMPLPAPDDETAEPAAFAAKEGDNGKA